MRLAAVAAIPLYPDPDWSHTSTEAGHELQAAVQSRLGGTKHSLDY